MKKNISRIAALLAAAALVFGAVGCSSDDDEDNTPGSGTPVAVTGVSVEPTTVSLAVEETATVTATLTPSNATDKTVTWSSDNPSVATVKDGVITAVAVGSATVTVTTTDGKKTATVAVTVTAKDAGGEGGGDTPVTPSTSATGKAKYLYLNITTDSSSEPSYAATYEGDTLGAKVSDVATYLTVGKGAYSTTTAKLSQKYKTNVIPLTYAQSATATDSTNAKAAANEIKVGNDTFYCYGKTIFTVTASSDKAATVTGIAGYFGGGKTVQQVYYSVDGGTTLTALASDESVDASNTFKGIYVKDSSVNITVAAGGTQTIELYLGKIAEKAPSVGPNVMLSQIDLTIAE